MEACIEVDGAHQKDYYDAALSLATVRGNRYSNFIFRHNLWDKFVAEDKLGTL